MICLLVLIKIEIESNAIFFKKKKTIDELHVRIMLGDVFGSAENQKQATYGLGYILTLTRNSDNSVLNKENGTNNVKF